MNQVLNNKKIKTGLDAIAATDREVGQALKIFGYPQPRIRPAGFEALVATIVSQQLSTKASTAIMSRIKNAVPALSAEAILAKRKPVFRKAGLSQQKVEYLFGLARAIQDNKFVPGELVTMDDKSAIEKISALHGFGVWSAEIYLMFSLGRRDIFPANDLALQSALQKLKKLEKRPNAKEARTLVVHWAPWRSVGSLFLWHYYQGMPNQL